MAGATYEVPALAIALLAGSDKARSKDYAAYTLEWLPLAASQARVKATFTVDSQVDFVALYATGNATDTANPPVENATPQFLINFNVADRQVFDRDIHWRNAVGSAISPFPIPFPFYMPRATTLTGFLTNLTAVANNVRITFHGFVLHTYGKNESRAY